MANQKVSPLPSQSQTTIRGKILQLPESVACSSSTLYTRALHDFGITQAEHSLMKYCSSGVKPSECTARQHRMLRELEDRNFVRLIEYPRLFDGSGWVLSDWGETVMGVATRMLDLHDIESGPVNVGPAKVLSFPTDPRARA